MTKADEQGRIPPWLFAREYNAPEEAAFVALFAREALAKMPVPTTVVNMTWDGHHYTVVQCTVPPSGKDQDLVQRSLDVMINEEVDGPSLPDKFTKALRYIHSAFAGPRNLGLKSRE